MPKRTMTAEEFSVAVEAIVAGRDFATVPPEERGLVGENLWWARVGIGDDRIIVEAADPEAVLAGLRAALLVR
ncbi:MAG: hypothetical protein ABIE42_05805 [Candidatus Eisenbacteria bacterium]